MAQTPWVNSVFPLEIFDPYGGMEQAAELIRQGNAILACLAPHPGETDSVHVARAVLQTELGNGAMVVPVAVHQYNSPVIGRGIQKAADYLGVNLEPVVTQRTRAKYPGRYTNDQEAAFVSRYLTELMNCFAHQGTGVIYTQGDRAGTMDTPPVRGAVSLVYRTAEKNDLVDKIALLPGYIHNPKAKTGEIRGFDPLVGYKIIWGQPMILADAVFQSETLTGVPPRMPKLDWLVHQQIIRIGNEAGVFPVRA